MSCSVPTAALSEVAELNPRLGVPLADDELVSFLSMSAVDAEHSDAVDTETRQFCEVRKGYTPFINGDVLVAKITPCFENGKIAQARLSRPHGFGSTEFHIIRSRPDLLDARYLVHYMRQISIRREGERKMTGSAGQRRVPEHFLAKLRVPLPPLPEQRRIAGILDEADALRAKRRASLGRLDALTQSIFLDMFGDSATNPKGWPQLRLEHVLSMPLRNGLSPSHAGKITAKVLTLSAITGSRFNPNAWKTSTFKSSPPSEQAVDENDFLICRGNGNIRLVGKGYFPASCMPDITFPDTMIAARVSPDRTDRAFFQHIWNSSAVRRQVESLARTTNGTYKVNQTTLEKISLLAPPLPLQRDFASRISALRNLEAVHGTSGAKLDALFASLQHRAFRGEL